jgi:hypothetical protein
MEYLLDSVKERDHMGELGVSGKIDLFLKIISKYKGLRMWTGFIWLRIAISGWIL